MLTFAEGGALDLRDLDGETSGERRAARHNCQRYGIARRQSHVHVH